MAEDVQPTYRAFVARVGGEDGRAWLDALPALVEAAAGRFGLEVGRELPGGLLACVREATTADGHAVVLKLPSPLSAPAEACALRVWAGAPTPGLLGHDEETGAMLLERIDPGTHPADAGADAVVRLLRMLHVPPPAGVAETFPLLSPTASQRVAVAHEQRRATPQRVAWAHEALERLTHEPPPPVLLHGDLDERNLLTCTRRGLCAIDPLPCVGDPLYDVATWVHGNRRPGRRARFDAIALRLELDDARRRRLRDWCGIVAVHG